MSNFTGTLRDEEKSIPPNMYVMELSPPSSTTRHVPAWLSEVTWQFDSTPCLYAGNAEGGRVYEVISPNDPLIEGVLQQYSVSGMFETNFPYEQFDENSCI